MQKVSRTYKPNKKGDKLLYLLSNYFVVNYRPCAAAPIISINNTP